ncbi:hypothetical protein ASPZODRAFT_20385 [Penicilliopsis zonata CBS 506.65]|uniref:Uncharacterized protein n=1 Tax=Penicilliopsis zonata CBS 506.65 TaxID=1073090 RepID=A0A1L9S629_9EURO|nr:hypothetical protein ASPZODRAFT_20385 [Penicilliopsis zonata CBS 506.65]OJJ42616.1 hypothetical protein ASPZODRAFT_20385 [Penicilliopsis zonata CBS 506.65]
MFKQLLTVAALALAASGLPTPSWSPISLEATSTSTSTTSTVSTAASASSSSSSSSSSSGVSIVNNLNSTVYLWSVSSSSSAMHTLSAEGGSYSETWQINSDGGGISIKMATSSSEESVLQFEYTEEGSTLYWDLSCINLDADSAFIASGFSVSISDSSCSTASCAAGDADCADAYQQSDDVDTYSCSSDATYTLTLG